MNALSVVCVRRARESHERLRLILPAFGTFTGGLSVLDPAISGLFRKSFQATLLGRNGLFAFPRQALV